MLQTNKKQIFIGLGIYFALRLFSYFFSPSTPLFTANPINWVVSTFLLLLTTYLLLTKDNRGWLIIAGEMILGGAGSFLEIKSVALRTILLVVSLAIYTLQMIKAKQNKIIIYLLSFIMATVAISAIRGYYQGHEIKLVLADAIPYFFLLYYFPLKELLQSEKFRATSFNFLISAIIGNFIFTYFTLAGFSSGIFILQDSYYHWFRDVASGKITDYGTGFFRIILNEQLLVAPVFLWFFAKQISQKHDLFLRTIGAVLLTILTINLTRIYFVAIAVGVLFLFSRQNWKRWLAYGAGALIFFILFFTATHIAATKGKSLGWEYLGLRLQSIAMPQMEDSSLSRMLLLPKIWEKIKAHPLLGNGLGDAVTVYSPIFKANITTPHFDWGYLEIWAEMGLIGLAAWLSFVIYLLFFVKKNKGLLASVVSLLVINITSPALFHVLGIILLVYLLSNQTLYVKNVANETQAK